MATSSAEVAEFPSPFSIATPPGCEGWEEMYPVLGALRRAPPRARREPALVLELAALPVPDAALRHGRGRPPLLHARRLAEPRLRGPARDGRRLPGGQRLRLHLAEPGHRPGQDRRARRVLREARRPLLPELGRAVRRLAHEDGGAQPRGRGDRGPGPARVRARRGRLRRPEPQQHRPAAGLVAHAPLRRDDVAAPLRVPAARLRRLPDVLGVPAQGAAGHPRPAHLADGRGRRRGPVPRRRRAAPARAAGDRDGRRRRVRRRAARRRRSTPRWPAATPAAPGWTSSRRSRTPGSTWAPATASTTTTAAGTTTRASRTRR